MKDLWNYLKTVKKPIVLYGMGDGADKIISVLTEYGIKISGVFASDGFVRKKTFHGFEVVDYSTAKARFGDMVVLLCFGTQLADVIDNIRRISCEQELYAPDVPVYGNTLFDYEYVSAHIKELDEIYNMLADEQSRYVFENTVRYKLTGKINYLFDCESSPQEPYKTFFALSDNESYLDLGAYRGDTVAEFMSHVNTYNKIMAVEPDFKTYKKLCTATEGINNLKNVNVAVSDVCEAREFNMAGSRGSSTSGSGKNIDVITIDSLSDEFVPTYIKMDIEGEELAAIRGGKSTILKNKPKMQIAAYHKSEDLIDIPKAVLTGRGDYKVYMRHFPCLPSWDTLYFFV